MNPLETAVVILDKATGELQTFEAKHAELLGLYQSMLDEVAKNKTDIADLCKDNTEEIPLSDLYVIKRQEQKRLDQNKVKKELGDKINDFYITSSFVRFYNKNKDLDNVEL